MHEKIIVAIDGMGGDNAPQMIVDGLALACQQLEGVEFLLFGDSEKLTPLLDAKPQLSEVCTLRHAPEAVSNDEKPTVALRNGRHTSMRLAIDAVKEGEASAVVSAGNTGALMAMALVVLRTLPGIGRPALATAIPTETTPAIMLDLGANIECDAEDLVQFAVMGEVFARNELGLEQPSIGILNVGVEGLKGNDAVKKAAATLQDSPLPIKFYGFVEGDDVSAGKVDVVVTDGFTGNIALKTAEGTVRMFGHFLKEELMSTWRTKLGAFIARPALVRFRARFDPRKYNGAMLVGLNGICVKSHGGTDAIGFANAVGVAVNLVRRKFNDRLKEDMERLISSQPERKTAAAQ